MSILDDVQEHVQGKRYDGYIAAICLFHPDSSPSLMIYPDSYKCVACGAHGSTKSLLQKVKGSTFTPVIQTKRSATNPFNRWLKKDTLENTLKLAYRSGLAYPGQCEYLDKRGITQDARREFKIGCLEGFYTIPIFKGSDVIGALARSGVGFSGSRYFVPKGQNSNIIFEAGRKERGVTFITFGVLDAISIWLVGKTAISTTGGKRIDPTAFDDYRKKLLFFPDRGEEVDAQKIISHLGWRGKLVRISWPDGCKDPNDLYCKNKQLLVDTLDKAYGLS